MGINTIVKEDLAGNCNEWLSGSLQMFGSNGNGKGVIKLYKKEFSPVAYAAVKLNNGAIERITLKDTNQKKHLEEKIKERLDQFCELKDAETELKKLEIEKLYSARDALKIAGKEYKDIEKKIEKEEKNLIDPEIEEGITSLSELLKNIDSPEMLLAISVYFENYFRWYKNGKGYVENLDKSKKLDHSLSNGFFLKTNRFLISMQQYL